jgi:hypothetical protein
MAFARRIIITNERYIAPSVRVEHNPAVRELWRLPRGIVLFESYHPVNERVYNADKSVVLGAYQDPGVRVQLKSAVEGERQFLEPLFLEKPQNFDGIQMFIPGKTAFAIHMGESALTFPALKLRTGWEEARKFVLKLHLSAREGAGPELQALLSEWCESVIQRGQSTKLLSTVSQQPLIECSLDSSPFDAICGLHRLLAEAYPETDVGAIERLQ